MLELLGPRLRAYFPTSTQDHPGVWISELFRAITNSIQAGDTVAVSMACTLIGDDRKLPFGKLIKSGLARALRQRSELLTVSERTLVLETTIALLNLPYAPRELEDYCRLLRKFPRDELQAALDRAAPSNAGSLRWHGYLAEVVNERRD